MKVVVEGNDGGVLNGRRIDFKEWVMGGGFEIKNGNGIGWCGCGSWFKRGKVGGNGEEC